jgi:hypothetical protein
MKTILWQRQDEPSLEYMRFEEHQDKFTFDGTMALDLDGEPARIVYHVECTPDWKTRHVDITQERAGTTSKLVLEADSEQRWYQDGKLLDQFTGISHIDLSVTPVTNLLAIRTMNLDVGQSQETKAVWVLFPELELEILSQQYTRIEANRYDYAAEAVDFQAILEVDDDGFITQYGDLWQVILTR